MIEEAESGRLMPAADKEARFIESSLESLPRILPMMEHLRVEDVCLAAQAFDPAHTFEAARQLVADRALGRLWIIYYGGQPAGVFGADFQPQPRTRRPRRLSGRAVRRSGISPQRAGQPGDWNSPRKRRRNWIKMPDAGGFAGK